MIINICKVPANAEFPVITPKPSIPLFYKNHVCSLDNVLGLVMVLI